MAAQAFHHPRGEAPLKQLDQSIESEAEEG
jgi:hypothetical protein